MKEHIHVLFFGFLEIVYVLNSKPEYYFYWINPVEVGFYQPGCPFHWNKSNKIALFEA